MKTLLIIPALLLFVGCAHFTTTQTDMSYEKGQPIRQITTHASATTLFDAQSQLAKFKATQSDKTQSASVGSLNESSSGTNVVAALQAIDGIVSHIAK